MVSNEQILPQKREEYGSIPLLVGSDEDAIGEREQPRSLGYEEEYLESKTQKTKRNQASLFAPAAQTRCFLHVWCEAGGGVLV